jgi:hypothetical protein
MKQPGNGCNYDDAESRPDCISNTDRDGFQNQRKKIKCDAITDYDNGGRGKLSKASLDFNADVAITSPTIAITRKSQPFMIYLPICVGLIMHA